MKQLTQYIKEELEIQINESFLLSCLLLGVFGHFGIKLTKKAGRSIDNVWKWTMGEKNLHLAKGFHQVESLDTQSSPIYDTIKESDELVDIYKNITTKDVSIFQVDTTQRLKDIFDMFKMSSTNKYGLSTIIDTVNEYNDLYKINKAPLYPNYAAIIGISEKYRGVYGLYGFSTEFWKSKLKDKDQKLVDVARTYKNALHVFDIDISENLKNWKDLQKLCISSFMQIVKEKKLSGITIKYNTNKEHNLYKEFGFEDIKELPRYMGFSVSKHNK